MPSRLKTQQGRPALEGGPQILEKARDRVGQARLLYENPAERDMLLRALTLELEESPAFAVSFITQAVNIREPWIGSLLRELGERVSSKPLRRSLRGGIYQLGQRGVAVVAEEERPEAAKGILRQTETQAPEASLSEFDDQGTRMLALVVPRVPQGRILVFGLIHWERGLEDLTALEVSRKQVKALMEETEIRAGKRFFPVDAGHGVFLLREAHDWAGRLKPEEEKVYAVLTNYLETWGAFPSEPNSHSFWKSLEASQDSPPRWDLLKEVPELLHLHLPPEEVGAYTRSLLEIQESPLVLNPAQQADRIKEVLHGAAATVFHPDRVRRLVRFIEETATLYRLKGMPEQAGGIMGALQSFQKENEGRGAPDHPLLIWLIRKELLPAEEKSADRLSEREERTAGGLILPAWVKK